MIDKKQQPLILTNRGRLVIFVAGTMTLLFCLYSNMTAKWPGILLLSLGSPCLILKAKVLVAQLCPILVILVTLWSVAHQASLSMEFSRQESWSGLPFPSPRDLPDPGIEPRSLALQADSLPSELPGK